MKPKVETEKSNQLLNAKHVQCLLREKMLHRLIKIMSDSLPIKIHNFKVFT